MNQPEIRDLPRPFGAEITGLDPQVALDDPDTCERLRARFDDRGLLVFRDVELDQLTQTNFARMLVGLARIDALPAGRMGADPMYVSNKVAGGGAPYGRLLFHSDTMWSADPIKVLSLYGVEIDEPAVPTAFASTAHAWETLPADLRARVAELHAVHGHDTAYPEREMDDPDVLRPSFEEPKTTTTPIARRHPRTGAILLYVSQQITMHIEGLPPDDSEALLDELFAHLYRPELVLEHHWRTNDLVAWDNLAVQHARPNVGSAGPTRTLRKVFAPMPERLGSAAHPRFAPPSR